ncbi:MAG: hypothetical protein MI923_11720 [Phycisphaerales bacterium]|nr:hypothetical protein [Phycisphaerales bacterium]
MNPLPRFSGFAIFLLAGSVLILQVALTRIFSVMTYHHFTYLIIGLALLGFGAAGTALTVQRRFAEPHVKPRLLGDCAWLFGVSTLLCFLAITKTRFDVMAIHEHRDFSQLFGLLMLLTLSVTPLFFGGLCIGYLISKSADQINRLYFSDLVGAGFGSLGALFAINYLGAPSTAFCVVFLACLVAILVAGRVDGRLRWRYPVTALISLGLAAACYLDKDLVPVPFPESKLKNYHSDDFRWHVVARVDVFDEGTGYPSFGGSLSRVWDETKPPMTLRAIYQDGAAFTGIVKLQGSAPQKEAILGHYMQGCAHVIRPGAKVLVIGPGGGVDVAIALHHGATHVTGVDLNPWTIDYVKTKFNDFAGGLYNRSDVDIVCEEGRHYMTATSRTFDVIQLSGVDTFTALATGAYALSENYVYTREAMLDYFSRLSEDGIVSFSRWLFTPPRETLRLAMTAREALEISGIEHPERHIVVIAAPAGEGRSPWADTMIKLKPFTEKEMASLREWCDRLRFDVIYDPLVPYEQGGAYDQLQSTAKYGATECAREFSAALRVPADRLAQHLDAYTYNITPCTDDNPFFFNFYRFKNLRNPFEATLGGDPVTRLPLGLLILLACVVQIAVIGGALILWPMRSQVAGIRGQHGAVSVLIYFTCLGLGFIMIEIMLLQKLMVFLGGPVYSMAVTLFSLLIFCGLGSFIAKAFTQKHPKLGGVFILLLLCAAAYGMTWFLDGTLPKLMGYSHLKRCLVAIGAMFPLGLLMGMPFPTGIRLAERFNSHFVPWGWCVNGCATVLGSVACILVSMLTGFTIVIYAAIGVYGVALLALLFSPRPRPSKAIDSSAPRTDRPDESVDALAAALQQR